MLPGKVKMAFKWAKGDQKTFVTSGPLRGFECPMIVNYTYCLLMKGLRWNIVKIQVKERTSINLKLTSYEKHLSCNGLLLHGNFCCLFFPSIWRLVNRGWKNLMRVRIKHHTWTKHPFERHEITCTNIFV